MSQTRGGPKKSKTFQWKYLPSERRVLIEVQDGKGRSHEYTVREIKQILETLYVAFGEGFLPLGNNVEKLGNGTERQGLATTILEQKPGDITHAQGSSYLGVILEEAGYFEWNGKHRGICWRITEADFTEETIIRRLTEATIQTSGMIN